MCQRHADYARELAAAEFNPTRRAELLKIAEACRAPYEAPRNFHEAVQSVWFTQMMIWADETSRPAASPGPTSISIPFYKADMENGTITQLEAQELLGVCGSNWPSTFMW